MSLGWALTNVVGSLVLVGIPAAIVYWRNKGRLSVAGSYHRGLLYLFRAMGWLFMIWGVLFLTLLITNLAGLSHWGYPWWTVAFSLGFGVVGYGLQRLTKFILRDPDANNMFFPRSPQD